VLRRYGNRALAADPPGWDGEQRGEPGIHGVSRPRRWDAVVTARAPLAGGNRLAFVALGDGVVVGAGPVESAPLRAAVEARLAPPYRAEAVRQSASTWAVAALRIVLAREPRLDGRRAELVARGRERTLTVDGAETGRRALALEALGERLGRDYIVRATHLAGELWEAEASPL
jgi:hypothetical protein